MNTNLDSHIGSPRSLSGEGWAAITGIGLKSSVWSLKPEGRSPRSKVQSPKSGGCGRELTKGPGRRRLIYSSQSFRTGSGSRWNAHLP